MKTSIHEQVTIQFFFFNLFMNKVFEMKRRCHDGSCLLFVGITCRLFWYVFSFGQVLLGIKEMKKLKSVLHSAVSTQFWGYTSFGMGPQYLTLASVFRRSRIRFILHASRVPVEHYRTLQVSLSFRILLTPPICVSIQT